MPPRSWETILFESRIPRVVLGGLVGMTLAVAGAVYGGVPLSALEAGDRAMSALDRAFGGLD